MKVLVTGARSGFGLLIARTAVAHGHTVVAGLRDVATWDGSAAVTVAQLDVTDPAQVDAVMAQHGPFDAVVNNAGIGLAGPLELVEEDELRRVFEVNLFGAWDVTRKAIPGMREAGGGLIIMVSSVGGRMGMPMLGAYASTKFALEGMSEAWAHELRPFGIRLALVEPGPFKTDIFTRNRNEARRAREEPYALRVEHMDRLADKVAAKAPDAQAVADRVVALLDQRSGRLRHVMGRGAKLRVAFRWAMPYRAWELLIDKVTLPKGR